MKKVILLTALMFAVTTGFSQEKKSNKQYRSAKTGQYVTKKQADKSPSTTYSTTRKSSTKKSK